MHELLVVGSKQIPLYSVEMLYVMEKRAKRSDEVSNDSPSYHGHILIGTTPISAQVSKFLHNSRQRCRPGRLSASQVELVSGLGIRDA